MVPLLSLLALAGLEDDLAFGGAPAKGWSASDIGATASLPTLDGGALGTPGVVPKRIFTYWSDPNNIPDLVAGCIARMKHFNPTWSLYVLYPNVPGVEPPPPKLANSCCGGFDDATHLADWYRAAALGKYGGVWLDSTAIVNQPLEKWVKLDLNAVQVHAPSPPPLPRPGLRYRPVPSSAKLSHHRTRSKSLAPSRQTCTSAQLKTQELTDTRSRRSLMCVTHVASGPELYCANINPAVKIKDELRPWLPYLTMHACFVVAWTRLPHETVRFISSSMDPGMPFHFLSVTGWDSKKALNLIFHQMSAAEIANTTFFKLRGDERKAASSLATYAEQGSVLAKEMLALISSNSSTSLTSR
ncbi:hypothetical protein AB1Y20_013234 [Prymnesium parvum]|uniref:Uncharacterized protein n=1 Tax=Prymnesium parvum TaxID=97485 RepID=A0AB34IM58_PRYPA